MTLESLKRLPASGSRPMRYMRQTPYGGIAQGTQQELSPVLVLDAELQSVGVSRGDLEGQFEGLLARMQPPTAELLAQLPELAAKQWQESKARITADARILNNRLADQRTLNQKAI